MVEGGAGGQHCEVKGENFDTDGEKKSMWDRNAGWELMSNMVIFAEVMVHLMKVSLQKRISQIIDLQIGKQNQT